MPQTTTYDLYIWLIRVYKKSNLSSIIFVFPAFIFCYPDKYKISNMLNF